MQRIILISLLLGLFAGNAAALPNQHPMPLLGEAKDSQPETRPQDRHVAAGAATRLLEQRHRG
ncbi:hypothetical protein PH586_22590 [Pseudomonas sp. SA3-5]|uniref:Uncharacterized protein n=1 Tax=Pseudomonas aestuarii TaxID=3018340 RepID=A0ABT4XLU9_9PSED|nr:hypothetical protein [Pseudomonas aestuarii]MDA7089172.1 hypothetical protein [Pseudomonas aestuarii]